jgi:hypothetical protein
MSSGRRLVLGVDLRFLTVVSPIEIHERAVIPAAQWRRTVLKTPDSVEKVRKKRTRMLIALDSPS